MLSRPFPSRMDELSAFTPGGLTVRYRSQSVLVGWIGDQAVHSEAALAWPPVERAQSPSTTVGVVVLPKT